jgi:uncharacterized repeat protein (TIGR02543 family)
LPAAGIFYSEWLNILISSVSTQSTTKTGSYWTSSLYAFYLTALVFGDVESFWQSPKHGNPGIFIGEWWINNFSTDSYKSYAMNIRCVHNDVPFTITYDADGGTPAVQLVNSTDDGRLVLCPITPTKPGYIFAGWHRNPDNVPPFYNVGMSMYGNITYIAHWSAIP